MLRFLSIIAAIIAFMLCHSQPARAQTLSPPAKIVVQRTRTALLVLDMEGVDDATRGPCNAATKPRCITTVPAIAGLLAAARAHGVLVVYSIILQSKPADIASALAPRANDPIVQAGPDKFIGTSLADILGQHGINRVIVTGTAAEGAVLDTSIEAILRDKMDVVLPLDCISSTTVYAQTYVAYDLTHAPGLAAHTVLTQSAMITF
jgi:nicotinamidase-related amidase